MTKIFEDFFSEYQADMVSICLEYVNEKADTVYIYCAMTRMTCAGFSPYDSRCAKRQRRFESA